MANNISTEFLGLNSFTPVIPVGPSAPYGSPPTNNDESNGSSSKGVSVGGLDQNMIKWLYEKGLPSDTAQFLSEMETAIETAFNPVTGKPNLSAYKLLLPKLALIRQEREEFDQAVAKMKEMGSYSEAAVNLQGEVYVIDALQKTITTKNIDDISEEDRILTNGELAQLRMNNPQAAFNSEYSFTIANGVSMPKITEYLLSMISKIGSTTAESQLFQDIDGNVIQGAKVLQKMFENGGKNQTGISETNILSTQSKALAAYTLNYILHHLPENSNMGAVIKLKAKQAGMTAPQLISELITSHLSETTKSDQKTIAAKQAAEKEHNDTLNNIPTSPVELFALGKTPTMDFILNDPSGSSAAYTGKAHIGNLKGNTQYDLLSEVQKGEFGGILDWNNATLETQKVVDLSGVQLANNEIISVELPRDPYSDVICPDMRSLPIIDKIEKGLKNDNIDVTNPANYEEINKRYTAEGLPPKYDQNGNLNVEYCRFAVIQAYADVNSLEIDSSKGTLDNRKITDEKLQNTIVRNFAVYKGDKNLNKVDVDDLVQGKLYIPMISLHNGYGNAILAAYQSSGTKLNLGQVNALEQQSALAQKKEQYNYKAAGSYTVLK